MAQEPEFEIISCSVFVRRPGEEDIFQVFPRLAIERSLKVGREDASSVRIASLIQALRAGIQFQSLVIESHLVTQLIAGTFDLPDSVTVGTTRIPDFSGDGFRAASSGYQFLGRLSQIISAVDDNLIRHTPAYTSGEIISALLTTNSRDFFAIYRPMNVTPETHFILVFYIQPRPTILFPQPALADLGICRSFSESSFDTDSMFSMDQSFSGSSDDFSNLRTAEHALDNMVQPPPFSDMVGAPNWEVYVSSMLSDMHKSPPNDSMGSSQSGEFTTCLSVNATSSSPNPPDVTRRLPYPARKRSGSLSTETSILLLLPLFTPPVGSSILRESSFIVGDLLGMVKNHAAMTKLLDLFGLDCTDPTSTRTLHDQNDDSHKLSTKAVFKVCGWSESTFNNKRSRYQNTEKAAKMTWQGEIPMSGSATRDQYENWRALVYFWSVLGPVATGIPPQADSEDEAERFRRRFDTSSARTSYLFPYGPHSYPNIFCAHPLTPNLWDWFDELNMEFSPEIGTV
ncbi:hypothetical protein DFH09DRAFT_1070126 [Mycena vulgaris]|nr:hypothetical protein DFH09DRAFT_1070126 [Mycena vulgaris]